MYRRAHPLNAPGKFYVEDDCCITCGIPFVKTADLFAWAEDDGPSPGQCYVWRQPDTVDEVNRMRWTIDNQELGCIRDDDPSSPLGENEAG